MVLPCKGDILQELCYALSHAASTVGYHVSRDHNAPQGARLMYMTEAIGVLKLVSNRDPKLKDPVTIVEREHKHVDSDVSDSEC